MKIVIIKYNAGNTQSVLYALERIGATAIVTDDSEEIESADKVIFPGVGEAGTAMRYVKERKLDDVMKNLRQPTLGVCLGMQLMCARSEEGDTACLGIFNEPVLRFKPSTKECKVPQVGWNNIFELQSPLFKNVKENSYCYFVHSYFAALGSSTVATADYVQPYSAALHRENFYGVQFHPEKSAGIGETILKNFIEM